MSLILEALRKSEAERQREGTPSVAMELPPAPARGTGATPGWVWPTLAIVVAGAILAGWWGMHAGKGDPATDAVADAAPIAASAVEHPAPHAAPAPSTPAMPLAPEPQTAQPPAPPADPIAATTSVPAQAPSPAPTPAPAPAPHSVAQTPPPVAPIPAAPAPAAPAVAASAEDTEDAPPISATGLPAVKLSMHMWDSDPGKRFVILDGQRMGEGDRSGGLQVIAIRRDGVIVERNGIRARVPLP